MLSFFWLYLTFSGWNKVLSFLLVWGLLCLSEVSQAYFRDKDFSFPGSRLSGTISQCELLLCICLWISVCGCGDLEFVWIFSVLPLWVAIPTWLVIWGISGLCLYGSSLFCVVGVWLGLAAHLCRGTVYVSVSAYALSRALFSLDIVELGLASGICASQQVLGCVCQSLLWVLTFTVPFLFFVLSFVCHSDWG